jgi:hypothetical protein
MITRARRWKREEGRAKRGEDLLPVLADLFRMKAQHRETEVRIALAEFHDRVTRF